VENAHYSLEAVAVRKLETKPRPNGEDHRTVIVLEFSEPLGGSFPSDFDAATDGSAPRVLPHFRPDHGVLPWRSLDLAVPRRLLIRANFPNQPTEFAATLKSFKATAKWKGEKEGEIIVYRLTLEKFPEPHIDGILGYYLGRKAANAQTGRPSACAYTFECEDHGSAVRAPESSPETV